MKTIDEMIAIMQAYKEGKTIEFIDNGEWGVIDNPHWNWDSLDYRVKPEPKYVPYDSVSEVEKNKWVRNKISPSVLRTITMIDIIKNAVYIMGCGWFYLEEFFDRCEYEDGTPCGKLVEE